MVEIVLRLNRLTLLNAVGLDVRWVGLVLRVEKTQVWRTMQADEVTGNGICRSLRIDRQLL